MNYLDPDASRNVLSVIDAAVEVDGPSADAGADVVFQRDDDELKYSAMLGDWEIANIKYTETASRVVVLSTAVDPRFRGRGIAGDLIADALDDIRTRGLKVTTRCPVVARFMSTNPQYDDLAS